MDIRRAGPEDAEDVAAVRIAGWRYAYGGIVPQTHLDAMSATEDAVRHRERLASARSGGGEDLLAVEDGAVTGWASWGPYREGPRTAERAELYALYLRPDAIGTGVGRRLVATVVDAATAAGGRELFVWVAEGNERARRFYRLAGFTPDGGRAAFDVGGRRVPELRCVRPLAH